MNIACPVSDCHGDVGTGFHVADVDVTAYLVSCLQVSGGLLVVQHVDEIEMTVVDVIVSAVSRVALEGRDPDFLDELRPFHMLIT